MKSSLGPDEVQACIIINSLSANIAQVSSSARERSPRVLGPRGKCRSHMAHTRKPLVAALALNTVVAVVEMAGGRKAHSFSLLMDGVHNFSDELALLCLVLAYSLPLRLSRDLQRMANLLNSLGLVGVSVMIVWQNVQHVRAPGPISAVWPVLLGLFAAAGNWGVARALRRVADLNAAIRLAYVHNLADTWVSLAPVLAGILVLLTGVASYDHLIALVLATWIVLTTLREMWASGEVLLWPENAVCGHPADDVSHGSQPREPTNA